MSQPKPPKAYQAFVQEYPKLGEAWETMAEAGKAGPIDERVCRLIKLGIAIGAQREGSVHSGVRKAIRMGITPDEIQQVVALAASTIGMPATVAAYTWVQDIIGPQE